MHYTHFGGHIASPGHICVFAESRERIVSVYMLEVGERETFDLTKTTAAAFSFMSLFGEDGCLMVGDVFIL